MTNTPFSLRFDGELWLLGCALPPAPFDHRPDWQQAEASWIARARQLAERLPGGDWYALDASPAIGRTPRAYRVCGRAIALWRDRHGVRAAPEPLAVHDDGVLCWVRLADEVAPAAAPPPLPARPDDALVAVVRLEVACAPRDVIANRLDPWHGVHLHPHSFARLRVIDRDERTVVVRVAYRLLGRLAVEVDARFHCPGPRTIIMTIERGEGRGSLVETHVTPLAPGRTAVLEATFARSERPGFARAHALAPALRPLLRWAAQRLWRDDAAYAERLHALRALRPELRTAPRDAGRSERAAAFE